MTWEHAALLAWPVKEFLASASMFLPPPVPDDSVFYRLTYAGTNALAMNFGMARNKAQPERNIEP